VNIGFDVRLGLQSALMVRKLFVVTGRVQGVYYRAFVRKHALALGLRGYAKNLASGDVEVLAEGEASAMDELLGWLHKGPPMSDVRGVSEKPADQAAGNGFEIR